MTNLFAWMKQLFASELPNASPSTGSVCPSSSNEASPNSLPEQALRDKAQERSPNALPAETPSEDRPVLVIDIETTGLSKSDRIISLAAIEVRAKRITNRAYYVVFDPRRDCQPAAARVHGWDDWTLRHQDLFADWAEELHKFLSSGRLLVFHNAYFDLLYLQREFADAGFPPLTVPSLCTMTLAREEWPRRKASLDACLKRIGISGRSSKLHNAYEDALLTANLYSFFVGGDQFQILKGAPPRPANYRDPPPRPEGTLPRRRPKRPKKMAPPAQQTEETPPA